MYVQGLFDSLPCFVMIQKLTRHQTSTSTVVSNDEIRKLEHYIPRTTVTRTAIPLLCDYESGITTEGMSVRMT